jgi:hypothetical protein
MFAEIASIQRMSYSKMKILKNIIIALGLEKIICPSTGECQGQEAGVDGLRRRGRRVGDSRWVEEQGERGRG